LSQYKLGDDMSELINTKLKSCVGLIIVFFIKNGFRYEGKLISFDGEFIEYFDRVKFASRYVRASEITELEVKP